MPAPKRGTRLTGTLLILLVGRGVSALGDFAYLIAINVWVLERTRSPIAVAAIWLIPLVPGILVGPFIGTWTDRWEKRRILWITDAVRGLALLVLPFLSIAGMFVDMFVVAVAGDFFSSALNPYSTWLIPESSRPQYNAWSGFSRRGALILGPAIGGALLLRGTPSTAVWMDSATFVLSGISWLLLPRLMTHQLLRGVDEAPTRFSMRLRADWRAVQEFFYRRKSVQRVLIFNVFMMAMIATADAQEVVFTNRILRLGGTGYGMLVTVTGVGFVFGSIGAAIFSKRIPYRQFLRVGGVLAAGGYVAYAFSHTPAEAAASLIGLGIFQALFSMGYGTYWQDEIPIERMGRVQAVVRPFQSGAMIAAIIIGGVLAHRFGVRPMMIGATIGEMVAAIGIFISVTPERSCATHERVSN